MRFLRLTICAACLAAISCFAETVATVRGVIHDPQHRPVQNAMVMIKARTSDWSATANSDANGNFAFTAVPLGEYVLTVVGVGFEQAQQNLAVVSGSEPVLHFALNIAGTKETINVSGTPVAAPTDSSTPTTIVDRIEITRTPGADRSNSMAMITDFVPGSYVTHDQLHIRGGHQTSWLIDGVPVPNTNIASNLGPQFDPKDIDYLEVSRGGYGAEFGDRTYGVFNVVPRTGFERNREAELVLSAGNFYQTNDQFSLGSHTERFAYYASVNGNRSNLGIQTPVPQVVHDAANGYGGFGSLIFNVDPSNQLRLVTSARHDYYQIPYDPFPNDIENAPLPANDFSAQYPSLTLRDGDHESDAVTSFSWVHTFNSRMLLTVSPFYHYNRANYDSALTDPVVTTQHRASTYGGGQVSFSANGYKNDFQVGLYSFYQRNDELLGAVFNDGSAPPLTETLRPSGSLTAFFLDDKFKPVSWLTLSAGLRPTYFSGGVTENSISPRFGVALNVPRLNWTFRASYGHYYQAPPLDHRVRTTTAIREQQRLGIHSSPRRARRRRAVRRQHSLARLGARRRHFSHQCVEFFRSQQHRRIQSLLPAHHSKRHCPRMGTHPALSPHRPSRPTPPRLFQPGCLGGRIHQRRPDRFFLLSTGVRSITTSATPSTSAAI